MVSSNVLIYTGIRKYKTSFFYYHKNMHYEFSAKKNKKSSAILSATVIELDLHNATVGLVHSALARQGLGCATIDLRTEENAY